MNFRKFQHLAKVVILPKPLENIDAWGDSEDLFQTLISKVDFKYWEKFFVDLPGDMDRVNFQSFRNCVFTQLHNYYQHGKSYWDE
jgi:hypothetical protein